MKLVAALALLTIAHAAHAQCLNDGYEPSASLDDYTTELDAVLCPGPKGTTEWDPYTAELPAGCDLLVAITLLDGASTSAPDTFWGGGRQIHLEGNDGAERFTSESVSATASIVTFPARDVDRAISVSLYGTGFDGAVGYHLTASFWCQQVDPDPHCESDRFEPGRMVPITANTPYDDLTLCARFHPHYAGGPFMPDFDSYVVTLVAGLPATVHVDHELRDVVPWADAQEQDLGDLTVLVGDPDGRVVAHGETDTDDETVTFVPATSGTYSVIIDKALYMKVAQNNRYRLIVTQAKPAAKPKVDKDATQEVDEGETTDGQPGVPMSGD